MTCHQRRSAWAFVLLLLTAASTHAQQPAQPVRITPVQGQAAIDQRRAAAREPLPQLIGFNLNLWHFADRTAVPNAIDRIAELGCNSVQIVTPFFQPHGGSPTVQLLNGPGRGSAADDLVAVMRYARGKGLKVTLMPQLNLTQPRGNEWRGRIQPPDWTAWWNSYDAVFDHYTQIAIDGDVDVLVIGCELLTTLPEGHVQRWQSLIDRTRQRYKGRLTFSANWDSYRKVRFWDRLDMVGISGYWDMTNGWGEQHPDLDDITKRWADVRDELLAFGKEQRKSILLTEVGYPSVPWGLSKPWNYIAPEGTQADTKVQTDGYRAFLNAWLGPLERPAGQGNPTRLAGVLFYEWDIYTPGGPFNPGYTIQGKPAEAVLRRWLAGE